MTFKEKPMLRHKYELRWVVLVASMLFICVAGQMKSQQPTPPQMGGATSSNPVPGPKSILNEAAPPDASSERMQEQRARAAQDDRHKRMATDADKLLALATELKSDVDKATKNETSVAAFQKANEIEKLAHDVKERLRN
jgi:hypothetical protein